MSGPFEEQMGDVTVCDKVCLNVVLTSSLPSFDNSLPWLMKLLGRGLMTIEFLLEKLFLGR